MARVTASNRGSRRSGSNQGAGRRIKLASRSWKEDSSRSSARSSSRHRSRPPRALRQQSTRPAASSRDRGRWHAPPPCDRAARSVRRASTAPADRRQPVPVPESPQLPDALPIAIGPWQPTSTLGRYVWSSAIVAFPCATARSRSPARHSDCVRNQPNIGSSGSSATACSPSRTARSHSPRRLFPNARSPYASAYTQVAGSSPAVVRPRHPASPTGTAAPTQRRDEPREVVDRPGVLDARGPRLAAGLRWTAHGPARPWSSNTPTVPPGRACLRVGPGCLFEQRRAAPQVGRHQTIEMERAFEVRVVGREILRWAARGRGSPPPWSAFRGATRRSRHRLHPGSRRCP